MMWCPRCKGLLEKFHAAWQCRACAHRWFILHTFSPPESSMDKQLAEDLAVVSDLEKLKAKYRRLIEEASREEVRLTDEFNAAVEKVTRAKEELKGLSDQLIEKTRAKSHAHDQIEHLRAVLETIEKEG